LFFSRIWRATVNFLGFCRAEPSGRFMFVPAATGVGTQSHPRSTTPLFHRGGQIGGRGSRNVRVVLRRDFVEVVFLRITISTAKSAPCRANPPWPSDHGASSASTPHLIGRHRQTRHPLFTGSLYRPPSATYNDSFHRTNGSRDFRKRLALPSNRLCCRESDWIETINRWSVNRGF